MRGLGVCVTRKRAPAPPPPPPPPPNPQQGAKPAAATAATRRRTRHSRAPEQAGVGPGKRLRRARAPPRRSLSRRSRAAVQSGVPAERQDVTAGGGEAGGGAAGARGRRRRQARRRQAGGRGRLARGFAKAALLPASILAAPEAGSHRQGKPERKGAVGRWLDPSVGAKWIGSPEGGWEGGGNSYRDLGSERNPRRPMSIIVIPPSVEPCHCGPVGGNRSSDPFVKLLTGGNHHIRSHR